MIKPTSKLLLAFPAKTPAVNNNESPGRKNPANSPVSANTTNIINQSPPVLIYQSGCNKFIH